MTIPVPDVMLLLLLRNARRSVPPRASHRPPEADQAASGIESEGNWEMLETTLQGLLQVTVPPVMVVQTLIDPLEDPT